MERYRNAMCMVTVFVLLCSKIIPSSEAQDVPKVYMIGDSTMANKPLTPPQPERGWGQLLPVYWKHPDAIHNHAKNGRSSKSFRTEGLWSPILEKLEQGDWVVIQFGHNDEKKESPERFTDPKSTFREELRRYINETRQKGANPVLATPIVRRRFDGEGKWFDTHGDYPEAVRIVAKESNTPLLDLHARTEELLVRYGESRSKALFLWIDKDLFPSMPDAKKDDTHLSAEGASRVCEMAIEEMRRLHLPLASFAK